MKRSLFILSLLVFVSPSVAIAEEDGVAYYTRECQETFNYSATYCSCALNHFSEQLKQTDERRLPAYEKSYARTQKALESEMDMTQDKLDAVCNLFDKAVEQEQLAAKSRYEKNSEMKREHTSKKLEYEKQAKDLATSYNVSNENVYSLISGGHCKSVHEIARMKKGLDEYDGGVYLAAREALKYNSKEVVHRIAAGQGRRGKCEQ